MNEKRRERKEHRAKVLVLDIDGSSYIRFDWEHAQSAFRMPTYYPECKYKYLVLVYLNLSRCVAPHWHLVAPTYITYSWVKDMKKNERLISSELLRTLFGNLKMVTFPWTETWGCENRRPIRTHCISFRRTSDNSDGSNSCQKYLGQASSEKEFKQSTHLQKRRRGILYFTLLHPLFCARFDSSSFIYRAVGVSRRGKQPIRTWETKQWRDRRKKRVY